jgi:hypothetical protein
MEAFPAAQWFDAFRSRVNADREMAVVGKWFTTTLSIAAGTSRHVIKVQAGQIVDVLHAQKIDSRPAFGFQAPLATWQKFISPNPPPLHNDFFAMLMRVPEFVLEGDGLVAMQNARALQRMMNLMREG